MHFHSHLAVAFFLPKMVVVLLCWHRCSFEEFLENKYQKLNLRFLAQDRKAVLQTKVGVWQGIPSFLQQMFSAGIRKTYASFVWSLRNSCNISCPLFTQLRKLQLRISDCVIWAMGPLTYTCQEFYY